MLTQIQVRNYAVVDEVELDLRSGLTVLTGETGAGKSILVDALGLVLGDRADSTVIRQGADRTEITAIFDIRENREVGAWLSEQDLDAGEECVLRRVINREGRSRGYINGGTVPMQSLKALGAMLVEIHGQHEHQSLTRRPVQRRILDTHGELGKDLTRVEKAHIDWLAARKNLDRLTATRDGRDERLDLVRFQVQELSALAAEPGELTELEIEHSRLANSDQLARGVGLALDLAYENDSGSAQQILGRAHVELERLIDIDGELGSIGKLFEEAEIRIGEAADELRRYLDKLEIDPARQSQLEERMASLRDLARKHQVEADALPQKLAELEQELEALQDADITLEECQKCLEESESQYQKAAMTLSKKRRKAAAGLGESITTMMRQLGMPGGNFEVDITRDEEHPVSPHGQDVIQFMVTANPGQPPAPLARVASGGELSRISLAVQVVATRATNVSCLVFDEVDSGVGGGVAEIVGQRLGDVGSQRQVLCVTHLPQVASQGHHHVRVSKLTDGKTTRTTLTELDPDQRVEELARMLGGVEITDTSREHAREMLGRGNASRATG
ncbi:MAG: DNA repair protein RecN [Gammaproteobacteria bacterium]